MNRGRSRAILNGTVLRWCTASPTCAGVSVPLRSYLRMMVPTSTQEMSGTHGTASPGNRSGGCGYGGVDNEFDAR